MKKIDIITTIGPATQTKSLMKSLRTSGATFFRLNMSHGDHTTHQKTVDIAREVGKVSLLCDLCGPKIRIGDFAEEKITLKKGQSFVLTTRKVVGTENEVYINYPNIATDLAPGARILLDDGKKELVLKKILNATDVETTVIVGGQISSRRGVNIPGGNLSISALTTKDKKDVVWGVAQGVEYFAISFVRSAKDVVALRKLLKKEGSAAKIVSKIETPEAVADIDAIIAASDMVMVARGDLAVEIGAEYVPLAQKDIVRRCIAAGKSVIVATQMLESMTRNPVPTRAEVSDIANAVLDGASGVMLSEETAVGSFPLEAVRMMARVIKVTLE